MEGYGTSTRGIQGVPKRNHESETGGQYESVAETHEDATADHEDDDAIPGRYDEIHVFPVYIHRPDLHLAYLLPWTTELYLFFCPVGDKRFIVWPGSVYNVQLVFTVSCVLVFGRAVDTPRVEVAQLVNLVAVPTEAWESGGEIEEI